MVLLESIVHDRIYGAVLGLRAGCSMGAATEYNWAQDRIASIQDSWLILGLYMILRNRITWQQESLKFLQNENKFRKS